MTSVVGGRWRRPCPRQMTRPSAITINPVADVVDDVHVVLDEQHGAAPRRATTWMCPSRLWVSAGFTPAIGSSSMISLGSANQRAGHLEQLALAAREVPAKPSRMWSSRKRPSSSSARSSFAFSWPPQVGGIRLDQKCSPIWCWAPSFMFYMTDRRLRLLVNWNVRTIPARASLCPARPVTSSPSNVQARGRARRTR